ATPTYTTATSNKNTSTAPPWSAERGREGASGLVGQPAEHHSPTDRAGPDEGKRSAVGAVDRRDDRLEGGGGGAGVDADPPQHRPVDLALHVGRRLGVAAGAQRVLHVVEHPYLDADAADGVDEGGDRPVADAFEFADLAVDADVGVDADLLVDGGVVAVGHQAEPAPVVAGHGQVFVLEDGEQLVRGDFAAFGVGAGLHHLGELDLEAPRQVEVVVGLHDVGDAALAGLAVDPDDGLVGAADVLGVDGQVRDGPGVGVDGDAGGGGVGLQVFEALLDGVLVGAGEGGVDEFAAPRVAGVDGQLVAVFDDAADLVDVAEVDLRVDALGEEVHAERDQADVAGALA